VVNPPRSETVREWHYGDDSVVLAKGDEMGRFLLGSTVVMLFPAQYVLFTPRWKAGLSVKMGESMGISYPRTAETRI
jgi:phosphatidylserine decarboxylase